MVQPAELPGLLAKLAVEPAPERPERPPPHGKAVKALEGTDLGTPAELVCPACHGVLTEASLGGFQHFRCHVGHAFSLESLIGEQTEDVERALWAAVRSLEEGAALSRRLNRSELDEGLRRRFADKERTLMRQADVIRSILLHGEPRLEGAAGEKEQQP